MRIKVNAQTQLSRSVMLATSPTIYAVTRERGGTGGKTRSGKPGGGLSCNELKKRRVATKRFYKSWLGTGHHVGHRFLNFCSEPKIWPTDLAT